MGWPSSLSVLRLETLMASGAGASNLGQLTFSGSLVYGCGDLNSVRGSGNWTQQVAAAPVAIWLAYFGMLLKNTFFQSLGGLPQPVPPH